jgi:hypothetical protein
MLIFGSWSLCGSEMINFPALGFSRPEIVFSTDDLPQPLGPSRQKNSPGLTVKFSSWKAVVGCPLLAKTLLRFSALIVIFLEML